MNLLPYLRAGYPGIFLTTHEEARACGDLRLAAASDERAYYEWRFGMGLTDPQTGITQTADDLQVLDHLIQEADPFLAVLLDYHLHTAQPDPQVIRKMKTLLTAAQQRRQTVVIVGCHFQLPPELEKEFLLQNLELPDRDALTGIIRDLTAHNQLPDPDPDLIEAAASAASGLTTTEATNAIALSIVKDGRIHPPTIYGEKAAAVKKTGLMELFQPTTTLSDVGGMDNIKAYLSKRKRAFTPGRKRRLPPPKGSLFCGLPGTGKSALCKAIAAELSLPLIRVDVGAIMGSLVGESERNFRTVKETAERIAPVLLWFDEIEKAFPDTSSGSGERDGGTMERIFGELLTWMSEKSSGVFVIATANDANRLNPALTRKGRWDEIWWVDLPTSAERLTIWRIMAKRYGYADTLTDADFTAATNASSGWTGAEIEAAFIEALYIADADDREQITLSDLNQSIAALSPMSIQQADKIAALRQWSASRCKPASPPEKSAAPAVLNGHNLRKITK